MESSSLSVSCSKRAKAPGNITQLVNCLVDGCNADLSLCRDYHRRHKVCEVHSKTAKVTIGGREQRFCQQCSRFHSLVEFDEGKRSCRKRLDGHNRRRRKPQPDTVARNNNSTLVLSAQQNPSGPRLLSFNSSPQILPSSVVSSSSWSNIMKKPENQTIMYNISSNHHHQHHMNSNERSFPNQIQFLQGDDSLDPANVVDSDHAPSLLSSGPTREFGLTHVFRSEQQRLVNSPLVNHTHRYNDNNSTSGCLGRHYSLGQEESGKNIAISGAESSSQHWSTLNFQGMFQQHDGEGSSASGSHQTLTFMWE